MAPAGGVATGWQLALRAKNIYGPYERKVVMDQGSTVINGPHQGAWITTQKGEDWFIHFQDKGIYGRVVHLQPMVWKDDWPVITEREEKVKYFLSDGSDVPDPWFGGPEGFYPVFHLLEDAADRIILELTEQNTVS